MSITSKDNKDFPKNLKKAEELYQQAYDLGHPSAAHNLYDVLDEDRMMKCLEDGRYNISCDALDLF